MTENQPKKKIYEIEIQEEITGKQRPRMNTYTGKAYTPTKTKNYEYLVRQIFVYKYPNYKPIEGRVTMTIIAYFDIPKSTSKKKEAEMLSEEISPTNKTLFRTDKTNAAKQRSYPSFLYFSIKNLIDFIDKLKYFPIFAYYLTIIGKLTVVILWRK